MRYGNVLEAVGNTPLVELTRLSPGPGVRIFAKLEGQNLGGSASVKDRVAKYMLMKAEEAGQLSPEKTILEATSGNTGIALAMMGRRKGYKVKVVMPDNVSLERRQLLELYGAEIVLTEGSRGVNWAIQVAEGMAARDKSYFVPNQFSNPANPLAHYETTGAEILNDLAGLGIDVLVCGIGTGGTITGVGRRLKEHDPKTRVVGVEPSPDDPIQGLRSLDAGFVPPILDLGVIDDRLVVSSQQASRMTRELLVKEGIFAGVSSGAVLYHAISIGQRIGRGNIVVVLPDGGWKYLSMAFWNVCPALGGVGEGQYL